MAEYISKESAISIFEAKAEMAVCTPAQSYFHKAAKMIELLPAADVAHVRHGRWGSSGKYRFQKGNSAAVRCTECGCSITELEYRGYTWNYCPVCGAKMECGNDG